MREFETGATRDTAEGKYEYIGFLSPIVLERFAEYMHQNRIQADGNLRSSSNWKKGIPTEAYAQSLGRHFMEWWKAWERNEVDEDALCAMIFNIQGLLLEILKHD